MVSAHDAFHNELQIHPMWAEGAPLLAHGAWLAGPPRTQRGWTAGPPLLAAALVLCLSLCFAQVGGDPVSIPAAPTIDDPRVRMFFAYPFKETIAVDTGSSAALSFVSDLRLAIATATNMSADSVTGVSLYQGANMVDIDLASIPTARSLQAYILAHGICLLTDMQMCGFTTSEESTNGEVDFEAEDGTDSGSSSLGSISAPLLAVAVIGGVMVVVMLALFVRQYRAKRNRIQGNIAIQTSKTQWTPRRSSSSKSNLGDGPAYLQIEETVEPSSKTSQSTPSKHTSRSGRRPSSSGKKRIGPSPLAKSYSPSSPPILGLVSAGSSPSEGNQPSHALRGHLHQILNLAASPYVSRANKGVLATLPTRQEHTVVAIPLEGTTTTTTTTPAIKQPSSFDNQALSGDVLLETQRVRGELKEPGRSDENVSIVSPEVLSSMPAPRAVSPSRFLHVGGSGRSSPQPMRASPTPAQASPTLTPRSPKSPGAPGTASPTKYPMLGKSDELLSIAEAIQQNQQLRTQERTTTRREVQKRLAGLDIAGFEPRKLHGVKNPVSSPKANPPMGPLKVSPKPRAGSPTMTTGSNGCQQAWQSPQGEEDALETKSLTKAAGAQAAIVPPQGAIDFRKNLKARASSKFLELPGGQQVNGAAGARERPPPSSVSSVVQSGDTRGASSQTRPWSGIGRDLPSHNLRFSSILAETDDDLGQRYRSPSAPLPGASRDHYMGTVGAGLIGGLDASVVSIPDECVDFSMPPVRSPLSHSVKMRPKKPQTGLPSRKNMQRHSVCVTERKSIAKDAQGATGASPLGAKSERSSKRETIHIAEGLDEKVLRAIATDDWKTEKDPQRERISKLVSKRSVREIVVPVQPQTEGDMEIITNLVSPSRTQSRRLTELSPEYIPANEVRKSNDLYAYVTPDVVGSNDIQQLPTLFLDEEELLPEEKQQTFISHSSADGEGTSMLDAALAAADRKAKVGRGAFFLPPLSATQAREMANWSDTIKSTSSVALPWSRSPSQEDIIAPCQDDSDCSPPGSSGSSPPSRMIPSPRSTSPQRGMTSTITSPTVRSPTPTTMSALTSPAAAGLTSVLSAKMAARISASTESLHSMDYANGDLMY